MTAMDLTFAKSNVNMYSYWWRDFIAENILYKKYYHDNEQEEFDKGNKDTAFDMFVNRVCSILNNEDDKVFLHDAIYRGDFILAGRSLYGAGAKGKFKSSLSNCYILPSPDDNLESIFDVATKMARIFSYGGGCGVDISKLRPRDSKVMNVARSSSGAVSFMNIFSVVGETIAQQNRRGAILIGLDCMHPDVEEFLTIKQNNDKVQGANISIKFTDEFMQAVEQNKEVNLYFKVKSTGEEITKTINARYFFMLFATVQHDWAEPAALFIDTVRKWNLLSEYEDYKIDITNPCAEFAGNAYNSCNLSSINLYNFVVNPYTELAYFDFDKFTNTVFNAVRVANQVLDYGYDTQPLNLNRKCIDDWRSIGIGVFGIADMLVALGIKYGNGNSKDLIKHIAYEMQKSALFSSAMYAKKHGSFGKFDLLKTMNSDFFKNIAEPNSAAYNAVLDYGLANGTLLSIAPTGSIAMLFRESGGIEPYYQVSYERTTHQLEKEHKKFFISMLGVDNLLKFNNIKDITADEIKKRFPFVVDTYDIEPYDRVDMQSAMQEYVDNAISSTINLKEDASITDIFNLYVRAWLLKCKGITIFRDNCKRISILGKNHGKTRDNEKDTMITENGEKSMTTKVNDTPIPVDNSKPKMNSIMPNKRGKDIKSLWGRTFLYHTACVDKFYVTVNILGNDIFEVFVGVDKGCQANIATITRLTSLALRGGIKVDEIVKNLNSAICPACTNVRQKGDTTVNKSCASCIASAIIEMQKTIEGGKNILKMADEMDFKEVDKVPDDVKIEKIEIHNNKMECPECGKATLIPDGKCCYCSNCGYSKCD